MERKENSKRKIYLDILKIIAMGMVFYVHTGTLAMHHYSISGERSSYWISLVLYVLATAGPTVFFFISGGLLLGKEESLKVVLLKRVLRYAILLVGFKIIQLIILIKTNPAYQAIPEYHTQPVSIVLKVVYSDPVVWQYWFLHAYIAFLLFLPFLRAMVQKLKDSAFIYLIILYLFVQEVLMIVEYYWENGRLSLDFPYFGVGIITPIIGYYFINRFNDLTKNIKVMIPLNIASMFFIGFDVFYANKMLEKTSNISNLGGTSLIIAIVLFCDVKAVCDLFKKGFPKWIGYVLGICASGSIITFLMDPQLHDYTQVIYDKLCPKTNWLIATIIWMTCSLLIGIIVAWILRLIPFVGILFGAPDKKKKEKKTEGGE